MQNQPLPHFITADRVQIEQQPWCTTEWLSRPGLVDTEHLLLLRAHMPPGQAHRFHRHPQTEELLYILSGTAVQWVGRERRVLVAGEMAHIPTNMVHATHNETDEVLSFLAILSPAHFEGVNLVDVCEEEPWRSLAASQATSGPHFEHFRQRESDPARTRH